MGAEAERGGRIGAERDEGGLTERDLSRVAHEEVEPERDERIDPDQRQQTERVRRKKPCDHKHRRDNDQSVTHASCPSSSSHVGTAVADFLCRPQRRLQTPAAHVES